VTFLYVLTMYLDQIYPLHHTVRVFFFRFFFYFIIFFTFTHICIHCLPQIIYVSFLEILSKFSDFLLDKPQVWNFLKSWSMHFPYYLVVVKSFTEIALFY
jgi:hypothetical protein